MISDERILEILATGPATAVCIARQIGHRTGRGVSRHLAVLEGQGKVERVGRQGRATRTVAIWGRA